MPTVYLSHYETSSAIRKYVGVRFLLCEKDELAILKLAMVTIDDWLYDVYAPYDPPYNWFTDVGYGFSLPPTFDWHPIVVGDIRAWNGEADSPIITFKSNTPPAAPNMVSVWE